MPAFVYGRRGKSVDMSYWSMPDAALDDSDDAENLGGTRVRSGARG